MRWSSGCSATCARWLSPPALDVGPGVTDTDAAILSDAQTSGGLLCGAAPEQAGPTVADLLAQACRPR
jgi:hypothetical protein